MKRDPSPEEEAYFNSILRLSNALLTEQDIEATYKLAEEGKLTITPLDEQDRAYIVRKKREIKLYE